jgi:hypothetical protein
MWPVMPLLFNRSLAKKRENTMRAGRCSECGGSKLDFGDENIIHCIGHSSWRPDSCATFPSVSIVSVL